jgi:hypothetical protein
MSSGSRRHARGGKRKYEPLGERWGYGAAEPKFRAISDGMRITGYYEVGSGRSFTPAEFRRLLFPEVY